MRIFFFFFLTWLSNCSSTICWKDCAFSCWIAFVQKTVSELSFLFHCSIYLILKAVLCCLTRYFLIFLEISCLIYVKSLLCDIVIFGGFPTFFLFSWVQSLSRVQLFATPWTAALQASLSITNSQSPPKPTSIESVMPPNHLILCRPLLLLPPVFPSIRVCSDESVLHIRWPKYWSFSFNISPSNEHPGRIFSIIHFSCKSRWLENTVSMILVFW